MDRHLNIISMKIKTMLDKHLLKKNPQNQIKTPVQKLYKAPETVKKKSSNRICDLCGTQAKVSKLNEVEGYVEIQGQF